MSAMVNAIEKLFTTGDASRYLGVSAERVRQLERSGQLRAERTVNGIRIFSLSAVEELRRRRQNKMVL